MGISLDRAAFLKALGESKAFLAAEGIGLERKRAERIVRRAKQLVHVESGETRDSIEIQGEGMTAEGPYVDVGSTLERAVYEEFGTEKTAPIPFMRPAIAEESR